MRRALLTYMLLALAAIASAQVSPIQNPAMANRDQFGNPIDPSTQPDSLDNDTEVQSLPPKLYMWQLEETLGERTIIPADTANLDFQNTNLVEGMYGNYNYLGNLGAPRLSRIYFDRNHNAPTMFMEPFSFVYFGPSEAKFTNSNVPYTNLTYYKAGSKVTGEERFKSYFSVNVNKRLAFGFNIDYQYGRGYYANQSTSHFNGGAFASYIGRRYQLQAVYNSFYMKMNENGGIADDRYITRPEDMAQGMQQYESTNIPVNLEQTSNRNRHYYVYLTHRYRLGFDREIRVAQDTTLVADSTANGKKATPKDSVVTEFVPVTSFIHTLKIERTRRHFQAGTEPTDYYDNTYLMQGASNDSTAAFSVKNVFGVSLLEGFNKYAKAGLTAYLSHKFSRYTLLNTDSLGMPVDYSEHEVFVGGELAKRQGKTLHYNVNGEIGLLDKAIGQFRVDGSLDLNFKLGKDTVKFYAHGLVSNTLPTFYMRHYHSNHFCWDNDNMAKEFRTRVEGELEIEHWRTRLRAGMENIKNYTYLDQNALPTQHGNNIQVLSAQLKQDFKLGVFHLDNEVTWQKSSNQAILPLPEFSLYHNFYILTRLFKKVLTVQLGADVRYFTRYHAPAYQPALQQFHLQGAEDQVEIGGYPFVNAYVNLHLKRTRIFVMMYHLNAGMGNRNYFTVPHYPINPRLLKIGISWNFYD